MPEPVSPAAAGEVHEFNVVAARHHSDQDIYHLARDMAG